tara:strand:+ start:745 stop:1158 length:414 start_codon:yes stop_codon:yes gene_type:complete
MGFINLGTRVGNGAASTPYVINYDDIRVVNCDDVYQVSAVINNPVNILVISIIYKFSQQSQYLLRQSIVYTAVSNRPQLEFTAAQYAILFTRAISSVSNTTATINAPQVNEFNPAATAPQKLIPVNGVTVLGKFQIS